MPDQDVYRMCPCGSGKKLKFCCQSVGPDLDRAADLEERNQFDKAIAHLEGVLQKGVREPSARTGVRLRLAIDLLRRESAGGPEVDLQKLRELVGDMITDTPDHLEVLGIDAMLDLRERGYPASQKTFSKLLQKCGEQPSACVSSAILQLASDLLDDHPLAGMQYLRKAVMLTPPASREVPLKDLRSLLANDELLVPLRANYRLLPPTNLSRHQAAFDTAARLFQLGCFSDAAKALIPIAKEEPGDGLIWWDMGVCHACAAEDPLAVRAFQVASNNLSDPEAAADCLVMARLLEQPSAEVQVEPVAKFFEVEMVSRLLTKLDAVPRLVRLPDAHDHDHDEHGQCADGEQTRTSYLVLDRPASEAVIGVDASRFARVLGAFDVMSQKSSQDAPRVASFRCMGRDVLESVLPMLLEAGGEDLKPKDEVHPIGSLFPEQAIFERALWYPHDPVLSRDIAAARAVGDFRVELWFDQPQSLLKGKSPREAADVPELQIPLRAAVTLLDLYSQRRHRIPNLDAVRNRLGLPPVPRHTATLQDLQTHGTILSLSRLDPANLDREVLTALMFELGTLSSPWAIPLIRKVLADDLVPDAESRNAMESSLTNLLERNQEYEACAEAIREILERNRQRKSPLQVNTVWEIKLMMQHTLTGKEDEARQVAERLWSYYLPKLPEFRTHILGALRHLGPEGPWKTSDSPGPLAGTTSAGGIWTPGAEPAAPAGGKLWVPGT